MFDTGLRQESVQALDQASVIFDFPERHWPKLGQRYWLRRYSRHQRHGVTNCTVEGEGIGARPTLTSADGSTVVERLETLGGVARRLSYALLTDTPFRDCLTTMMVRELGRSRAELEWSATFEADGLPAEEARELLKDALAANCRTLKQLFEG